MYHDSLLTSRIYYLVLVGSCVCVCVCVCVRVCVVTEQVYIRFKLALYCDIHK